MAKSKKSKILAMALCASVMTGIYASPVLAADVTATQNANNDILFTVNDDTYTISRGSIASAVARNGIDNLTVGNLNITGAVTSNIHTYGSVTANANFLTRGGSFAVVGNTQYAMLANKDYFALGDDLRMNHNDNIERATFYVDNATGDVTSKGNVSANTFSNSSNTFNVAEDGTITAAVGSNIAGVEFNRGAIDFKNAQLRNIARVTSQEYISGHSKFEDGKLTLGRDEGQELTAEQLANINSVIGENGVITAADGSFKVREGNGETVIAGSAITSTNQNGNTGVLDGSDLRLQSAGDNASTHIGAGYAEFGKDGVGTIINGDAISAKTLNGKVIDDLVVGTDIEDDLANIAGISRQQDENGVFYTNVEGTLTVSEAGLNATKDDSQINLNENGINLSNGNAMIAVNNENVGIMYDANNFISVDKNGIGLKGNVVFDTANYGSYTLSGLVDRVEDIYNRTEHITVDEAGNTTISSPNGDTTLTVTDEGVNVNGNGNVGGNANVDGNLDVDGTVTAPNGDFDKVSTDEVTVGDETYIDGDSVNSVEGNFSDKVTVGTGTDITTIDGGTITTGNTTVNGDSVSSVNGNFDNLNSTNGGTIGGVKLEDNTVTADKVVTGETTLDSEGLNVGGKTSVTADGVNVGGVNGTSIKNDSITVGDGGYIGGGDVVSGEGVSLNQTAERVGNLENRVGELEDRIDKVGAMAAAIANLRTMGYDPAAPTEVAVGIGQYRDETGAALGLFHYPNRDFMLSLSVSTSGDEVMGGIGATWKFGRKSPEKVAEIKKAQAEADARRAEEAKLAKAEEMKQAAKEAKIKAQQERHAKLAAERAAQAEAAK